ncbi:hypothetical protein SLEP1_g14141 [Rubroshorea leprosula]|uniref:Uncharacterized protein n=1 Tax=Rubroshorea leprosula TaxID=152421 RepID=A0AAV5ISQ0_9ROSI|nr:hypothetical protein SLEP1_g14141 [Rubroshorea leprosula]
MLRHLNNSFHVVHQYQRQYSITMDKPTYYQKNKKKREKKKRKRNQHDNGTFPLVTPNCYGKSVLVYHLVFLTSALLEGKNNF